MKKLRLRKWCKYTLLAIVNLVIILNLPLIIKNATTLNDYRHNIIALGMIIIFNTLAVCKIEN